MSVPENRHPAAPAPFVRAAIRPAPITELLPRASRLHGDGGRGGFRGTDSGIPIKGPERRGGLGGGKGWGSEQLLKPWSHLICSVGGSSCLNLQVSTQDFTGGASKTAERCHKPFVPGQVPKTGNLPFPRFHYITIWRFIFNGIHPAQ